MARVHGCALKAESAAPAVLDLLSGPRRTGVVLGPAHIDFGGYVVMLTRPGAPRMPNGLGALRAALQPGTPATVGGGRLDVGSETFEAGPGWDPRPRGRAGLQAEAPFMPEVERWAGAGPGLTPAGDDVLAGYIAALVLYRGERGTAAATAERAAARTGSLAATLLRHAARGELPEPAHRLLDDSDPAPLLAFGHSSGPCLMLGLALGVTHAGEEVAPAPRWGSGVELRVTTRRSGDAIVVGHAWI